MRTGKILTRTEAAVHNLFLHLFGHANDDLEQAVKCIGSEISSLKYNLNEAERKHVASEAVITDIIDRGREQELEDMVDAHYNDERVYIPTHSEVDALVRAIVRAVQNDDMNASAKACNAVRRVFEVQRGEVPLVPAGYTAEELERDNPYNQWMKE